MAEISLNIIVGKNECDILKRCLESIKDVCDEIVITLTSDDTSVETVAKQYATVLGRFAWCDDFSAARNYSFSLSTKPYIFWLDSDDVVKPEELAKIRDLKPRLDQAHAWLFDYAYTHDDRDQRLLVLPRERIVANNGWYKWEGAIHECMAICTQGRSVRAPITIDHYRVKQYDPDRNIRIMKKHYDSGRANARLQFYYGKELLELGRAEGAPILERYLSDNADWVDNQAVACYHLAKHYLNLGDYQSALKYGRLGTTKNPVYAENWCMAGIAHQNMGQWESAETAYKAALEQTFGSGGMSQYSFFYCACPHLELASGYYNRGRYSEALSHVDQALLQEPHHRDLLGLRRNIEIVMLREEKIAVLQDSDLKALNDYALSIGVRLSVISNRLSGCALKADKRKRLSVAWLIPQICVQDPPTRLRRLNISAKLNELGIPSRIVDSYHGIDYSSLLTKIGPANTIIVTNISEQDLQIINRLQIDGHTTIVDTCEAVFGGPYKHEMMTLADAVVCSSSKLTEMTKAIGHPNVITIRDAAEDRWPSTPMLYENRYERPKAAFVGCGGNSWLAKEWLKPVLDKAGYDLVLITEWADSTVPWDLDTWPDEMIKADVILCPQRVDLQPAKSNVKVTQAMSFGIPVIASPIQSYMEIIRHGTNGYIAKTLDDWYSALIQLKVPENRRRIGCVGFESAKALSLDNVSRIWADALDRVLNGDIKWERLKEVPKYQQRESVDIIIPVYNNLPYLKLCLNSILMNTTEIPFRIILSDAGSDEDTCAYLRTLKGMVVILEGKRKSFSEACNSGILASNTQFFVIMNSDVIVSKGWLAEMMSAAKSIDRCAAVGVLSNCDRGWYHDAPGKPTYPMRIGNLELVPGMKIEQIEPVLPKLYEFMEESNRNLKGQLVQQAWLAEYCVLHARCAVDEVGYFDPIYRNGCEDLDLMTRLQRSHYRFVEAIGAFVFHFGGVSRGHYQESCREQYDKEDVYNHTLIRNKWAHKKVLIYTGPAWEKWGPVEVEAGMAGSETWACYIAKEFAKRDYEVSIYGDPVEPMMDGDLISYIPHTELQKNIAYNLYDLAIISRTVEPCKLNLHALRKWVMIHDVWLSPDKNYDCLQNRVDGYAVLSPWHRDFVQAQHKIASDKLWITANGLSPECAWAGDYPKTNSTVYSSSPDRGLLQLLDMLPEIRAVVPDFVIHICYGFYNWKTASERRGDADSLKLIALLEDKMKQPGVEYHGRVSKLELALLQKHAKVWLYPTWFSETYGITAIENAAAGNALITSDYAGLQVSAAGGMLIPIERGMGREVPLSPEYKKKFLEHALRALTDEGWRKAIAARSLHISKEYRWGKICDQWIERTGLNT